MRNLLSFLFVSIFTLSGLINANACGDKTLRVGRGIRFFQLYASSHPSTILIYSQEIASEKSPPIVDFLKRVGHKPKAVGNTAQLSAALRSVNYDLVLTDLTDAATVQKQVDSLTPKTVVVPVVGNHSKAEKTAAARQYKFIVKNATTLDEFAEAVQRVMKAKTNKS
jgi:DNA-binding NtrC family response regulator